MRERIHYCTLIEIFCVNIYSVSINLRKICVISFMENYRESLVREEDI